MYEHGLTAGMFDPVTVGHMELIRQASLLCRHLTVGVFHNVEKTSLFDAEQRTAFLRLACRGMNNVDVVCCAGMVADFARRCGVDVLIRGVRNDSDLQYEEIMRKNNLSYGGPDTVYVRCPPSMCGISSTAVRDLLARGETPDGLLPREAEAEIMRVYGEMIRKKEKGDGAESVRSEQK